MSKRPVTPQAGGEPSSRALGADAAPSQPRAGRVRYAEGAGGSAAMAARGGPRDRHVSYNLDGHEGAAKLQPGPDSGGAVATPPAIGGEPQPRRLPTYTPPSQRGQEQQPRQRTGEQPPPYGQWFPSRPVPDPEERRGRHGKGLAVAAAGGGSPSSYATPGGAAAASPPGGIVPAASTGGAAIPQGRLKTTKTIERVSTLVDGSPSPSPSPPQRQPEPGGPHRPPQRQSVPGPHWAQPHQPAAATTEQDRLQKPSRPKKTAASPMLLTDRRRKETRPLQICFTLCCILFWLLVVCIGLAILVVYLLYHPKSPRLHVSTATLNAGYVDQLPPPHVGEALNSDLYVLAAIYNPNTKLDVALRYMQLDLYFQGRKIGTQAVWPPLYERPGDSALRSVHLVVSEVMMSHEDAEVWKNTTATGGLVEMQLQGKFYVQLNFGRWLPFRYTVRPSCSLWLDPPPAGALRRARCRV